MSRWMLSTATAVFAVSLCALLLMLLAPPVMGQTTPDTPAAPEAPGSLAGVVTDEAGTPLAGIEVMVHRTSEYGNWVYVQQIATDANGAYRAALLRAGIYRVSFRDPTTTFALMYYAGSATLAQATDIIVAGADISGIDMRLPRAATITGVYTGATDNYYYTRISALNRSSAGWEAVNTSWVNMSGTYSLTSLPPGVYAVCVFQGSNWDLLRPEVCYDDIVSAVDNAQPLTLTAGITATDIDLDATTPGDGAVIAGSVYNTAGAPLPAISVSLIQRFALRSDVTLALTTTNALGAYSFERLHSGAYYVKFTDENGPYLSEVFTNATEIAFATPIRVERYAQRRDVDAILAPGGMIRGTLTLFGQMKPYYAWISLNPVDASAVTPEYGFHDIQTGEYRFTGVRTGRYRIHAQAFWDGLIFSGWYGGASEAQAAIITVTAGALLTGFDITLGEGAYDGVIAGRVTAGGAPRAGIKVSLLHSNNWLRTSIVYTTTNAGGAYAFNGLPAGSYHVRFDDPSALLATVFYSDTVSPDYARPLELALGGQALLDDVGLRPGGAMTGRIIFGDTQPPGEYSVGLWYVTQDPWFMLSRLVQRAVVADDGTFHLAGLPAGNYRVCAMLDKTYEIIPAGCYGGPQLDSQPSKGRDVPVRAGEVTREIDIYLMPALPYSGYLPLIGR